MRFNPGYHAVQALQHKSVFPSVPQVHENQEGSSYFFIRLVSENTPLKMVGKIYQLEKAPHVSIYQFYKMSETKGLSAFHYTWYGFVQENVEEKIVKTSVVLHVYFNCVGQYLYCQLKKKETNEVIQGIAAEEERAIQRYAQANSNAVLDALLQHISTCYLDANHSVENYLKELDKFGEKQLETQVKKYINLGNKCVEAIEKKNMWSFGDNDSRLENLKDTLSFYNNKLEGQKQSKNSAAFFSPEPNQEGQSKEPGPGKTNANAQYQLLLSELRGELDKINKKIQESNKNKNISESEKALVKFDLLNNQFRLLINADSGLLIDKELLKVSKAIHQQHRTIESLFKKKACEGDVEAVKSLKRFVSFVDQKFFRELILAGNVAICEYVVQNFSETVFYLNFCLFYLDVKDKNSSMAEMNFTLLQIVFYLHDNPLLLEVLLRHGANPNFHGENAKNEEGILYLSVVKEKEEFVRILLENGADPNPKSGFATRKKSIFSTKDFESSSALSKTKTIHASNKAPTQLLFIQSLMPLEAAIDLGNKRIVSLLLQHGASVAAQNKKKYNAIGSATCDKSFLPNMEIIKILLEQGADINAVQGEANDQTTALCFACQRNDIVSVKSFIALGADPNQQVWCKTTSDYYYDEEGNPIIFNKLMTAFAIAAAKGHTAIVEYFMEQKQQPITFQTAASTYIHLTKSEKFSLEITVPQTSVIFNNTPMMDIIETVLFDEKYYDNDTINIEIKRAYEEGGRAYQEGNQDFQGTKYELAIYCFYQVLRFGDLVMFQSVTYSLGLCFNKLGDTKKAIYYFTHCLGHDTQSKTGQAAYRQLEKLLENGESLTMRFSLK